MNEHKPHSSELESEPIPSYMEVLSAFGELAPDGFKVVKKYEDEKGLYALDVVVPGESENEYIEYFYVRKGRFQEREASETEIHGVVYVDNTPMSAAKQGKYINGKWIFID